MNIIVCPHCHVHLNPCEVDEVVVEDRHYLICPECDEAFPIADILPTDSTASLDEEGRDA